MDGTDRLCMALYCRKPKAKDYLGGSDAAMIHDAASKIEEMRPVYEAAMADVHRLEKDDILEYGEYDAHVWFENTINAVRKARGGE